MVARLTTRAAQAGVPTAEYLGVHVLASAFGVLHPTVQALRKRDRLGIFGPETGPEIDGAP